MLKFLALVSFVLTFSIESSAAQSIEEDFLDLQKCRFHSEETNYESGRVEEISKISDNFADGYDLFKVVCSDAEFVFGARVFAVLVKGKKQIWSIDYDACPAEMSFEKKRSMVTVVGYVCTNDRSFDRVKNYEITKLLFQKKKGDFIVLSSKSGSRTAD